MLPAERMPATPYKTLRESLWRIYRRAERPQPWTNGGNLPWDEPGFAERMLREHLDESHAAASRRSGERAAQIDWLWKRLALQPGSRVYDVTCGPGLYSIEFAKRGCATVGIDISPAAIRHARSLAAEHGVDGSCRFVEADVRGVDLEEAPFDAALFLYGQLAVFPREEAARLCAEIAHRLAPGGRLAVELLDRERVDKKNSSWWFTDDTGVWGDTPFLHLGERFWNEETQTSTERIQIVHLETGVVDEIILSDQTYSTEEAFELLEGAGFDTVHAYPVWDGLPIYDAAEWTVYVATKR